MTSKDYVERDLERYRRRAGSAALALAEQLTKCAEPEQAIAAVTAVLVDLNGDRQAHKMAGALKPGERQYFIAGCFLLSPQRDHHLLIAENGFPAEQHRLKIPVDLGHPGRVYRERKPLLLTNTDEHGDFKQILKTSRMGSAIYAPMIWQGRFLGQVINAAQARNTMSEADLHTLVALTHLATLAFVALGGELHE
jgi:hypothetical protein